MIKRVCNMCGNDFDVWDEQENFSIHKYIGYGSRFDNERIDLDVCCDCFDRAMMEYIIPKCKLMPFDHWTKEDIARALEKMNDKNTD